MIGKDEIEKTRQWFEKSFKTREQKAPLTPMIVGCVDYTYSVALPAHRQTGFMYTINGYHPDHPNGAFVIDPTKKTSAFLNEFGLGIGFFAN